MRSFEPGETWGWCHVDQIQLDNLDEMMRLQGARATP
jgi:hypothetical protein